MKQILKIIICALIISLVICDQCQDAIDNLHKAKLTNLSKGNYPTRLSTGFKLQYLNNQGQDVSIPNGCDIQYDLFTTQNATVKQLYTNYCHDSWCIQTYLSSSLYQIDIPCGNGYDCSKICSQSEKQGETWFLCYLELVISHSGEAKAIVSLSFDFPFPFDWQRTIVNASTKQYDTGCLQIGNSLQHPKVTHLGGGQYPSRLSNGFKLEYINNGQLTFVPGNCLVGQNLYTLKNEIEQPYFEYCHDTWCIQKWPYSGLFLYYIDIPCGYGYDCQDICEKSTNNNKTWYTCYFKLEYTFDNYSRGITQIKYEFPYPFNWQLVNITITHD